MAIEIIPKKREEGSLSTRKIVLYIGLFLLFLSVIGSVVIFILTQTTSQDIGEVRAEIKAKEDLEKPLFDQMRSHYKRVMDFVFLLDTRVSPIPAFEVIERVIHPNVYLGEIQINMTDKSVSTTGIARDVTAFDQQVRILQADPMIASVVIGDFTRKDDGQVIFPIVLTFKEELFNPITN